MTLRLPVEQGICSLAPSILYPNYTWDTHSKPCLLWKDLPILTLTVYVHKISSPTHMYAHNTFTHTNVHTSAPYIIFIYILLFPSIFHAPCYTFPWELLWTLFKHNYFRQTLQWFLILARGTLFQWLTKPCSVPTWTTLRPLSFWSLLSYSGPLFIPQTP